MADEGALLEAIQADAFAYFAREAPGGLGLVPDSDADGAPCSVAGLGFALTCLPIAVERGWMGRADAAARAAAVLRFLDGAAAEPAPRAASHRGFYYHFLDVATGGRARRCEVSTIDSAILFAGALTAQVYFDRRLSAEEDIRSLADGIYRRAEWRWALAGGDTVCHGWRPERGFLPYRWRGYNEALLLYVLALGSPTHGLGPEHYDAWTAGFRWRRIYGIDHLYAGPLFIHQFPQVWLDLRFRADPFMRERGIGYFENSRRATLLQRDYAVRNPRGHEGYGERSWGVSASDGPGPAVSEVRGRRRRFFDYTARGVPWGPDDGTLAPWAVAASLPFAPEIVLPSLRHMWEANRDERVPGGFHRSFNPSFPGHRGRLGWVSSRHYAINQGPTVAMIENHRTGLVWRLAARSPYVRRGLFRAGFRELG